MSSEDAHYVTVGDGTVVAGAVSGEGPPLVFVHGIIGDGASDWQALVPHLADRFTCHLPSLRGRGLSGASPDLGFARLIDDLLAYVASIPGPVGLVGWSLGAGMALAAAGTRPGAVDALAVVEPGMPGLMTPEEQAGIGAAIGGMAEQAAAGSNFDAVRAFAGFVFEPDDIAAAEDSGYFAATERYVPAMLDFFGQPPQGPAPDDPVLLGAITAPVLVLHGPDPKPYVAAGVRQVVDHVAAVQVREITGAGHAIPLTHPAPLAEALAEFFTGRDPQGHHV
ncbi:alpha/beta fold hydrolase [Glycomyces sp. NPDC048151]|uniref:alpha/beta fold hydrolase n=1 Tax=Glycomyces sp. NPDC048151 TaxID=3364002 RepID=UPI003718E65D